MMLQVVLMQVLTTNPVWYYCKNYNDGTTHSGSFGDRNLVSSKYR